MTTVSYIYYIWFQVHRLVVVDEDEKVIGIISLSDILLYLVLKPCGENNVSPDGVTSVRAQVTILFLPINVSLNMFWSILQDTELQTSSRTSSTEEVSETIPEEEEHAAEEELKAVTPEDNDKGDSDNSLPDSPVLETSSLPDKNPIFREVTVTGGE